MLVVAINQLVRWLQDLMDAKVDVVGGARHSGGPGGLSTDITLSLSVYLPLRSHSGTFRLARLLYIHTLSLADVGM